MPTRVIPNVYATIVAISGMVELTAHGVIVAISFKLGQPLWKVNLMCICVCVCFHVCLCVFCVFYLI